MTSRYPLVRLREVLSPAASRVRVEPDRLYSTAGIYSWGKGLFPRQGFRGAETTYRDLAQLRAGQFVYSRLFAWEGALAVVSTASDGLWVSPEFPVFDVAANAKPEYLAWLCRWPRLWEQLREATSGMGLRRQRVHPERLLELRIPLPGIEEQDEAVLQFNDTLRELLRRKGLR